ncbi:MAG: hemolysin family protein, partial [Bdellovibrionaceae bacterium]|nr:hemolysin family protein [Pseudobdellovibrionaceae bacterium]
ARKGNAEAARLLKLRDNPERTLSVIQIGITMVGATSAAVGGVGAIETLSPWLEQHYRLGEFAVRAIPIVLVIIPLTYMSVVLGELVPKTLAMRSPLRIASASVPALLVVDRLLGPFVTFLENSTKLVLRLFQRRLKVESSKEDGMTVDIAGLAGTHQQYVINLVQIEHKRIKDILVPWSQVDHLDYSAPLNQVLGKIVQSGHTRLPVIREGEVVGILHSKEFMSFISSEDPGWQSIIRSALKVQVNDSILRTLRLMQEQKKHMALVYAGQTLMGVVTLEDILEEVVGDIYDEDDDGTVKRIMAQRKLQRGLKT